MKNFWTIVAGIAGIAWLAWLSLGLWNGLWWTSIEQTAFITQQTAWTSNFDPNPLYIPKNGDSKGGSGFGFCGNSKIEGDEQCEVWQENKCMYQGSGANNDLICNTDTCKCEQLPITGCYYGLDVAGGTITSHTPWDPKELRDGWVYTVKPWSYIFDCKFDTQHIFINGLSTDPWIYTLPPTPSYPSNMYYLNCGSDTGAGCYYTIKVNTGMVYTWNSSWCATLGVQKSSNITFIPWVKLHDPAYGWSIAIKKQGSYNIDCSKAIRDWYKPNKARINNRNSIFPSPWIISFFDDKKGKPTLNRLDCITQGDDWLHATCWYDVKITWKIFD